MNERTSASGGLMNEVESEWNSVRVQVLGCWQIRVGCLAVTQEGLKRKSIRGTCYKPDQIISCITKHKITHLVQNTINTLRKYTNKASPTSQTTVLCSAYTEQATLSNFPNNKLLPFTVLTQKQ